jgi:hypothetical protein
VLRLRGGHCQVPCGIFDDPAIVAEVKQACATIRKAMVQINELGETPSAQNFNQAHVSPLFDVIPDVSVLTGGHVCR